MSTRRNIHIEAVPAPHQGEQAVEMCEHKGVGHPDTLTDGACEAAAQALAQAYMEARGRVLHFNVDKGLLIAGQSAPSFGGGKIIEPIKLIVCGRAAPCPDAFDVGEVVVRAVNAFLQRTINVAPGVFEIVPAVKAGSASLANVYGASHAVARANDTSFGVGFAPYSQLEQDVLHLAEVLRSAAFKQLFPAAGDDFKIMGLRTNDARKFTVALALIDRHIANAAQYFAIRRDMVEHLRAALPQRCEVVLNCLDRPDATDESGLHLTVTGLSAEMGDDGQVGRGNRVNGLITPNRPMSLEAAAGKNPVAHVGKLYNVLAHAMAHDLAQRIDGAAAVDVRLLSTIGQPVDQPQMVHIALGTGSALTPGLRALATQVANDWLDRVDVVSSDLVHGRIAVY